MMSQVFDENFPQKVMVPDQNLLRDLYEGGYDVVFVRFFNPNIDINANAKVLEKAMIWLNAKASTPAVMLPPFSGPAWADRSRDERRKMPG